MCPCSCPCFCTTLGTWALSSDFFARLVSSKWPCPALCSKGHNICPPYTFSGTSHHLSWNPTLGYGSSCCPSLLISGFQSPLPCLMGSLPYSSLPSSSCCCPCVPPDHRPPASQTIQLSSRSSSTWSLG